MKVTGFQKEFFEVELDGDQLRKIYNSYPASVEDLLDRMMKQFIEDVGKNDNNGFMRYNRETHCWMDEDIQTMNEYVVREATPMEKDFFENAQIMRNIILSLALTNGTKDK
jgi:hypothetical protein